MTYRSDLIVIASGGFGGFGGSGGALFFFFFFPSLVDTHSVSAGASGNKLGVGYLSRDARLGDIDRSNQADSGIFGLPGELALWLWSGFYGCAPMSPDERHIETSNTKDPNPKYAPDQDVHVRSE